MALSTVVSVKVIFLWCCVMLAQGGVHAQWDENAVIQYQVKEEQSAPRPLGRIITDAHLDTVFNDVMVLKSLRFNFLPSSKEYAKYFTLDTTSSLLSTAVTIDRETICPAQKDCYINLDIAVHPPEHFRLIRVQIEIIDENDSPPRFPQKEFNLEISEATLPDTMFTIPTAVDLDSPIHGVKRYTLSEDYDIFDLDQIPAVGISGQRTDVRLVLTQKLDRETTREYNLIVYAHDDALNRDAIQIHIKVLDANDNTPQFTNKSYELTLLENTTVGSEIIRVRAHDRDSGSNGAVEYKFAPRTQEHYGNIFQIDSKSGRITLQSALDYEKASIYHLTLHALDKGPEPNIGESSLVIKIKDVNNHKPSILVNTLHKNGWGHVSESAPLGTFVAYVSISDQDSGLGGSVDCKITNTNNTFRLKEVSKGEYQIVTSKTIDRENRTTYEIKLHCKDNGSPSLSHEVTVPIKVLDENDHSPVFARKTYNFTFKENNKSNKIIATIKGTDKDSGNFSKLHYTLRFKDPTFRKFVAVDRNTGEIRALTKIDHERVKLISFRIYATDGGNKNSSALVNIAIQDENDNGPRFTKRLFNFTVLENEEVEAKVDTVKAYDIDSSPFNKFTFSLQGNQQIRRSFDIHPLSGQITTKRILDRERKSRYKFIVVVSDPEKASFKDTASVIVTVKDANDNPPLFQFPTPTNNTVYVSSYAPVGATIAHVSASDKDAGENAIVEYSLLNISGLNSVKGAFEVDARYGIIRTIETLDHVDFTVVIMYVSAEDLGFPIQKTAAKLVLHINSSLPYISPQPQGQVDQPEHLAIVVGILIGTALVIVVLIIAILLTRKSGKRKEDNRYNCRAAALKLVKSNGTTVVLDHKPVKLDLTAETGNCGQHDTALENHCDSTVCSTDPASNAKTYLQVRGGQVHQFLNIYAKDQECDSSGSGDLSITDSGRGPSEEGENNDHDDRHKMVKAETRMLAEDTDNWNPRQNSREVDYRPHRDYRSPDARTSDVTSSRHSDMTSFHPNGARNSWQRRNNEHSSQNIYSPDPTTGLGNLSSNVKRREKPAHNDSDPMTKAQANKKKRVRISDTVTALEDNSACIFDFSGGSDVSDIHADLVGPAQYPPPNFLSETEI